MVTGKVLQQQKLNTKSFDRSERLPAVPSTKVCLPFYSTDAWTISMFRLTSRAFVELSRGLLYMFLFSLNLYYHQLSGCHIRIDLISTNQLLP